LGVTDRSDLDAHGLDRKASAIQLGHLWGGFSLALVVLSPFAKHLAAGLPRCPVHSLAHVPCPTCGTATAALALARFDVVAAFAASPLAAASWIALVGGGAIAGLAAMRGHGVPEIPAHLSWRARIAVGGVILANWVYLIVRG
jgi:hypothetical protein